jgi:hypothetical protein
MTAATAKPNTINWLATILAKAQGVLNTETGDTVDIGLECANIRREYDRLKLENDTLAGENASLSRECDRLAGLLISATSPTIRERKRS